MKYIDKNNPPTIYSIYPYELFEEVEIELQWDEWDELPHGQTYTF